MKNTPYKLVYGHDLVLPLEVNLQHVWILRQNDLLVDDYWNSIFDEFSELKNERLRALENIIQRKETIVRSYNQ